MTKPGPNPDAAFLALDEFLMSDRSPEDCMQLSDLDGFLTGIAVSPDMILPSEWLSAVWGGGDPEFASAEEAQQVLGTLMLRYNYILMTLEQNPDSYQPLLWGAPDGRMLAVDWAEGFLDAIKLRRSSWDVIWQPENLRLIAPIAAFWGDASNPLFAGKDERSIADIQNEMVDLLPDAVVAIHRFWKNSRSASLPKAQRAPVRSTSKVGRNDSCPCGSGRKYKKCCGAN